MIGGAVLSGFLGITEPALFGVLTKYKMAFAAAAVGSVVGSAFISFFGVRLYGCITFGIPACIGPYFPLLFWAGSLPWPSRSLCPICWLLKGTAADHPLHIKEGIQV